jgi:PAS domain S-box-containing protein
MRNYASLLFLLLAFHAIGQEIGKPMIQNFSSKAYRGHTQNWAIEQDTNGIVYIGNQAGVLSYDGYFWRTIPIDNHATIRSLTLGGDGKIYVGAVGEFGFLDTKPNGLMIYKSLLSLLDSSKLDFGNVWNCAATNQKVFFLTDKYLFVYQGNQIKTFTTQSDYFYSCFALNQTLYVHDFGFGLLRYKNDSLIPLPGGTGLANQQIHALLPFKTDTLLVGIRNFGFIEMDTKKGNLFLLNQSLAKFMNTAEMYCAAKLDANRFACGTLRKGLVIVDSLGRVQEIINKQSGLQDETIYYLKASGGILWAAMEKGIAAIEWQPDIRYWDETSGLLGSITDMVRYNKQIIASSGSGVFRLNHAVNKNQSAFTLNDSITEQTWDLQLFSKGANNDSIVLVGTGKGLWEISKHKTKRIFRGYGVYKILPSQKVANRIYLGTSSGLDYVDYNSQTDTFTDLRPVSLFANEVRDIFENPDGSLWVSLAYKGAALIEKNDSVYHSTQFGLAQGLDTQRELRLFIYNKRLCFSCESGVYNFDATTQRFYPDSLFHTRFKTEIGKTTFYTRDSNGNHWINGRFHYIENEGRLIEDTLLLKRLPDFNTEFLFADNQQTLWIGTSEGIYKIQLTTNNRINRAYKTQIRKVYTKNDSVIYWGKGLQTQTPKIIHKNNFIGFIYTAAFYEKPESNTYSYFLKGYDNEWSEWTKNNQKEYTNLFEGTYTFKVRARNYLGWVSPATSFTFTINPPVYRTWYAYILYVLLITAAVSLIVFFRTKKLRFDKLRLEKIIHERTIEVIRQKDEIEASANHLAEANRELKKLSVIAQKTDNAVAVFDASGNMEWINEGFTRMYGYTYEQFITEKSRNLIKASGNKNIEEAVKACIDKKETTIYQYFTLTRCEEGIWAQTTLTPILDEAGQLSRIIAIDSDITKIKDAEQEIQHQRDELKKANETKDKFFSIIAHDLRGPLSNIFTLLNIMHSDMDLFDATQMKTLIGQLKESTGNTFNLTENLLDWAHLRRDNIRFFPKKILLADIVDDNRELFESQAAKKNIALINQVPKQTEVFADEEMVKTIIRNLLGNAIKFTNTNGQVVFSATETPKAWWIHVTDTGKGMDASEVEKLFRIDVHHSTPGTQQEKGTGLGLILIKEFLEKNKGHIRVESARDKGSTFSFSLPKEQETNQ